MISHSRPIERALLAVSLLLLAGAVTWTTRERERGHQTQPEILEQALLTVTPE